MLLTPIFVLFLVVVLWRVNSAAALKYIIHKLWMRIVTGGELREKHCTLDEAWYVNVQSRVHWGCEFF